MHRSPTRHAWTKTLALCLGLAAGPTCVPAATLTWDQNGTGAGQGDGGETWLDANQWWNGTSNVTWNNGTPDTAIIGVGGTGGTINLTGGVTTSGITFNPFSGTYTLGSGALTVGSGGILNQSGAGNVLFGGSMGLITLGAPQTWANQSSGLFTYGSSAATLDNGGHLLTFDGSGSFSFVLINITGTGGLTKNGSGDLTLGGNGGYSDFTGPLLLNGGSLTLAGGSGSTTSGGGIAFASSITVNAGTTLHLAVNGGTGTLGTGVNRIDDAMAVTLNGGTFSLASASARRTFEQFGALDLASGASKVTVDSHSNGIGALSGTTINRTPGSTVLFGGNTALGSTVTGVNAPHIQFTSAPTAQLIGAGGANNSTTISILSYAIAAPTTSGTGTDFVTYDTSVLAGGNNNATVRGIRPLAVAEYATTFADASATLVNVKLANTAITGIDSATTINSLILTGSGGVSGTGTLTVNSGALLATGTSTASLGVDTLAFGSQEAVIHSVANLSIGGNITGSNGLTKSGTGLLTLSGNTAYTGTTTINQGNLKIGNGGSTGSIGGNGAIVFFDSSNQLIFDRSDAALVAANAISGAGNVLHQGTGTVALSGANSYTGGTRVSNGGVLSVSTLANGGSNSGIGAASSDVANLILHDGSTLRYTGTGHSTDRLFQVGNTSGIGGTATLDASGGGAVNFTNPGAIGYGTTNQERVLNLTGTNAGNNTLAAALGNNGTQNLTLNKTGAGTWVLTGNNSYTGTTTVSAGTLELAGGSNSSPSYVISSGASFTQSSGTWSTDLFHSSGSSGDIAIADLADSSDGTSVLRYSVDAGGAKTLVFNDGNPFAQAYAGSVDAWSDEWTILLDTLVPLETDEFTNLNLMASTGGYSLLNLNGKLNIQAWNAGGTPTLFTDVQNGSTLYLSGGVALGSYEVQFTADSFDLVYQSSFAIPEPGTLGLLAMAFALLRWRLRRA